MTLWSMALVHCRAVVLSYHAVIWVIGLNMMSVIDVMSVMSVTSAAASEPVFGDIDFIVTIRVLLAIEQKDVSVWVTRRYLQPRGASFKHQAAATLF